MEQQLVLRPKQVAELLGISVPTVYRWEKAGVLPPRRKLGPNVSGWLSREIRDFADGAPLAGGEEGE